MKKLIGHIFFIFLALTSVQAQDKEPLTRILFIFDASNSMYGTFEGGRKIKVAQQFLSETLDSLKGKENLELALRAYGHTKDINRGQDCNDTHLEVPFAPDNVEVIKNRIKTIQPKGTTPIARSLEFADQDFPDCPDCRNVVILITDGIEACDGDPCAVSRALQARGVILKPFVIGIGLSNDFKDQFRCIGDYYDASDAQTFKKVLNIVVSEALNTTTAQVNLLDIYGAPIETDVNMTFTDANSGVLKYNYMHTMNRNEVPDTLTLDPMTRYQLKVHTIPPVVKSNIELIAGEHNIIEVDAPQGTLELKQNNVLLPAQQRMLKCIVREANEMQTLHVQSFDVTERYIVGTYDLEILTLPRFFVEDVEIAQSEVTTITLPQPGHITFQTKNMQKGHGSIYQMKGDEMIWIYNLNPEEPSEKLEMLPGNYKVVYRNDNSKRTIYTIEKNFSVFSGKGQIVKLY